MRLEIDLPDAGEREWLLAELARLCAAAGATPLLTEPVLPSRRWFPDAWDGRESGLARLARRVRGTIRRERDRLAAEDALLHDAPPVHEAEREGAGEAS